MTTGEFKKYLEKNNIPDDTTMRIVPGYLDYPYAKEFAQPHVGVVVTIEHKNNTVWLHDFNF